MLKMLEYVFLGERYMNLAMTYRRTTCSSTSPSTTYTCDKGHDGDTKFYHVQGQCIWTRHLVQGK